MKKYLLSFIIGGIVCLAPMHALAATLNVSPGVSNVEAGDIVTVRLIANTQGTAINQGEGTLQFPTDMLDVVSASKAGSIFTLWVEEPSYSNAAGTVSFDGGLPTPGFNGANGTIISVTFHAKRAGTATLSLANAALRANDGMGTDVLASRGGGQIVITDATPVAPVTPTPVTPAPAKAQPSGVKAIANLASPSHSDQTAWYQNDEALITWDLPAGASSVQTTLGSSPESVPTVEYRPAITEKRVTDIADGTWYFNIRPRFGSEWGPISSYQLNIDHTAPKITSASVVYDTALQMLVVSAIDAVDATSGIDRYELSIDGGEPTPITLDELASGSYRISYAKAGTHTAVVSAIDKAGNQAQSSGTFSVPTPLADQVLWNVFGIGITFAWLLILILLISLLSLAAAGMAWYKLFVLRQGAKSRREKRDKLLHRSLRIYKEDLERHLRSLERAGKKRDLTDEEATINEDLAKNVDELEKYLAKEFKKFD